MLKDFSKEKFDIIVQAGQSNSEGCGRGPCDRPFSSDHLYYLTGDFVISRAQEQVWENDVVANFSLSFCRKYLEDGHLENGRKLLVIRAAVGGTGFLDKRWGMQDDLYLRMMEMIKTTVSLNNENRLLAFLWHQGETDAHHGATMQDHEKKLSGLVSSVRDTFNVPSLPFVCGDFVQGWKKINIAIAEPVVDAIINVTNTIDNARFVETQGFASNDDIFHDGDDIHFCRQALYDLGERYYKAFLEIKS